MVIRCHKHTLEVQKDSWSSISQTKLSKFFSYTILLRFHQELLIILDRTRRHEVITKRSRSETHDETPGLLGYTALSSVKHRAIENGQVIIDKQDHGGSCEAV